MIFHMLPGLALLLGSNLVLAVLFLNFKKEIAEQAVEDAREVSEYMRKVKANKGNSFADTKKIKHIKGEFPEGAKAIFYKNMLQMRKTGNFLRKQDIVYYYSVLCHQLSGDAFQPFLYVLLYDDDLACLT